MTARYFLWSVLAGCCGLAAAFLVLTSGRLLLTGGWWPGTTAYHLAASPTLASPAATTVALGQPAAVTATTAVAPAKEIRVDLSTMQLTLWQAGQMIATYPVVAKGRPGSPWETPAGQYQIKTKELSHFSSIGEVWMPYSMQFFGNFFIHGWPTYASGQPVGAGYSGGCIRLTTADAKAVFAFATPGTVVQVLNQTASVGQTPGNFYRFSDQPTGPAIAAKAYLVADLNTGELVNAQAPDLVLPIASVTKLMTGLVALEALDQDHLVTISARAIATATTAGELRVGERLSAGTLLYPLLLESSNDAAEALAEGYGREAFIKLMNDKAAAIGLDQTHFVDPSGLSPGNVSTARDLLHFLRYLADQKSYLLTITRLGEITLAGHHWWNNDSLAANDYFIGGKIGQTSAAKETLAAIVDLPLSEFSKRSLAVVVLGSPNRSLAFRALVNDLRANVYYSERRPSKYVAAAWQAFQLESPTLTLNFVGDIMVDRGVAQMIAKHNNDYHWLFEQVGALAGADILFGNLEGPASDQGMDRHNLYSFRMDPEIIPALVGAGFNALSLANNHAGDWGRPAFTDTLKRLESSGLVAVGAGGDRAAATQVKVLERQGQKIGFLGFTDVGPDWLVAGSATPGLALANDPALPALISQAAKAVDILVVSFHFGEEYQVNPTTRQQSLAHLAIDAGAKIVVGHHPHVVEPLERYHNGVIIYSLGNFIFDQDFSAETMSGQVLQVRVRDGQVSEVTTEPVQLNHDFQPSL